MASQDRLDLFETWASTYDESMQDTTGFPFQGYRNVLTAVVDSAQVAPGMTVLDVGTGTGNLAHIFVGLGCAVTGIDFSPSMLDIARDRVPPAQFSLVDLQDDWGAITGQRFDLIVSAYVFHEFPLETKIAFITRFVQEHLLPEGRLVIADISFATSAEWTQAHDALRGVWDEDEHYWCADEALELLAARDLAADYVQVAPFTGMFVISANYPKEREPPG